jgi:hypothetical protein
MLGVEVVEPMPKVTGEEVINMVNVNIGAGL